MTNGGMRGADPQQLMALSKKLEQQGQAVTTLKTDIKNSITSTTWEGPAQQNFVQNWDGNYAKALDQLSEGLRQLGEECQKRADAIMQIL
jgi:WXG100 family type VII secretion target